MRYQFTREDCSKGGKNGSKEDKARAGHIGFWTTYEKHPFFARHWLRYCRGMRREKQGIAPVRQEGNL